MAGCQVDEMNRRYKTVLWRWTDGRISVLETHCETRQEADINVKLAGSQFDELNLEL